MMVVMIEVIVIVVVMVMDMMLMLVVVATHLRPDCSCRYIRSERSVILINFCLSIISSNALILIGQTQTRNKVGAFCHAVHVPVSLRVVMVVSQHRSHPSQP